MLNITPMTATGPRCTATSPFAWSRARGAAQAGSQASQARAASPRTTRWRPTARQCSPAGKTTPRPSPRCRSLRCGGNSRGYATTRRGCRRGPTPRCATRSNTRPTPERRTSPDTRAARASTARRATPIRRPVRAGHCAYGATRSTCRRSHQCACAGAGDQPKDKQSKIWTGESALPRAGILPTCTCSTRTCSGLPREGENTGHRRCER